MQNVEERMRGFRELADELSVELIWYEGGNHWIQNEAGPTNALIDAFIEYEFSDLGAESLNELINIAAIYTDWPYMQFCLYNIIGRDGLFTHFRTHDDVNPKTQLVAARLTQTWHTPSDPPRAIRTNPAPVVTATADTVETISLPPKYMFSSNWDSIQVTDPAGQLSADAAGNWSGDLSTPQAERTVTITATNARGSAVIQQSHTNEAFVPHQWQNYTGAAFGFDLVDGSEVTLNGGRVDAVADLADPTATWSTELNTDSTGARPFFDAQTTGNDGITRNILRFAGAQQIDLVRNSAPADNALAVNTSNEFLLDMVTSMVGTDQTTIQIGPNSSIGTIITISREGNETIFDVGGQRRTISSGAPDAPLQNIQIWVRNNEWGISRGVFRFGCKRVRWHAEFPRPFPDSHWREKHGC